MAATMNGEVHENRHENLHDRKKRGNSWAPPKTPAQSAREIRRPTKHQIRGFMMLQTDLIVLARIGPPAEDKDG
jgi:hypothetical protein